MGALVATRAFGRRGCRHSPFPPEHPLITDPATAELYIGTAGWTVPAAAAPAFPEGGTHLQRYARVLRGTEINSSFHRPHKAATYVRWRESVPEDFRFSVKVPKTITHKARLVGVEALLEEFLDPVRGLDEKLGCLLIQLPPSLSFDEQVARTFFTHLRSIHDGAVALEPRNQSWFAADVEQILSNHRIARVAADPEKPEGAREPGGSAEIRYFRLHGSPRTYYSTYNDDFLRNLAARIRVSAGRSSTVWCIFDNTTLGAATPNALDLVRLVSGSLEGEREG